MASNINPIITPYEYRGSFRFWCQKVLPLVYDDSLSYYELLCKVVDYLNSVLKNADNMKQDINNLNTAFKQLQDYVNQMQKYIDNYFKNLDVQEEINNKLDAMVASGVLEGIIAKYLPPSVNYNFSPSGKPLGGQLFKLLSDINNPFIQDIQINLVGDSITWGAGASEASPGDPRSGLPSDPRNNYQCECWANIFKRYIKSKMLQPVTETLSNHPDSPSGECIVTYQSQVYASFYSAIWTSNNPGSSGSVQLDIPVAQGVAARFYYNGNVADTLSIEMQGFTGDSFAILYRENAGDILGSYGVYVNDNLVARLVHTGTAAENRDVWDVVAMPGKVYNAKVTIKPIDKDPAVSGYNIRLIQMKFNKTITIDNEGINGTNVGNAEVNIRANGLLTKQANYTLIALGTNNRLPGSNALTNGGWMDGLVMGYERLYQTLLPWLGEKNIIMIGCTPATKDAPTPPYIWNVQTVNSAIMYFAAKRGFDYVNMNDVFNGLDNATFLADGLHPNDFGHQIMARNIAHMMSV